MKHIYAILLACCMSGTFIAHSQTVVFTSVASGLSSPVDIVAPPDASGRLFIVEKGGTIRIYNGTSVLAGNFLDISALLSTSGEQGLLSMAFHPDYATNRFFFVLYTNTAGDVVLSRYRTQSGNPNAADVASGSILLTVPHPVNTNHNGGKIAFGTDDLLYWSIGDGGGGGDPDNNAQDGGSRLGKIMRLAPDTTTIAPYYSIPPNNPYVSDPAFLDEIWAFGLRNPWRWSFDRSTGDMWIADVGQGSWEEVNFVAAADVAAGGHDFGWRCREGAHVFSTSTVCSTNFIDPVFEYDHSLGNSITGGYVYRGIVSPDFVGKYVCVDFGSPRLWLVTKTGTTFTSTVQNSGVPSGITGFGEDAAGELYAVTIGGNLYTLGIPVATGTDDLLYFSYRETGSCAQLLWQSRAQDIAMYGVERSDDGRQYRELGRIKASPGDLQSYTYDLCSQPVVPGYYRLRLFHTDGSDELSQVLHIRSGRPTVPLFGIAPNPVPAGTAIHLRLQEQLAGLELWDLQGRRLQQLDGPLHPGYLQLPVATLAPGTYLLKARGGNGRTLVQKVVVQ